MTINVIMADDHELIRQGMKHLLADESDIKLKAEVANGTDLMKLLRGEDALYDLVLMDLNMPGRSGLDLLKQVKQEFPDTPVIVLSTYNEEMYAVRCIKSGASAYLCKDDAAKNLVTAIRHVMNGGVFITPGVANLLAGVIQSGDKNAEQQLSLLSDREYQILLLLAGDKSVTEVANDLCLSVKTISTYKARIKLKLGLNTNGEITRFALEQGLIEAD